jgi:hypothetical protein
MGDPLTTFSEKQEISRPDIQLIQLQEFLHDWFRALLHIGIGAEEKRLGFVEEDYAVG